MRGEVQFDRKAEVIQEERYIGRVLKKNLTSFGKTSDSYFI
ncbi:hypothetical protein [Neobacillus niacini]|nr:hypothetical protein [Neobacillus niacini]